MTDRQQLKEKLFAILTPLQSQKQGSPLTNLSLERSISTEIENLTASIEAVNPNLYPLLHSPQLLDGVWWLNYSTAREIRSLDKLPLGLKVGKVYQAITLNSQSFLNQAFVKHPLGLISGYVKVTANFEIAKSSDYPLPDKRINVQFLERIISITAIAGLNTPQFDPLKVVEARGPQGRIPTLDITYLDENLRIGRGGDGSLFILSKVTQIQA